jgi:Zn-finger nucleic acid-binding protein
MNESRICCYCGVTQELDLRQVHFRDLGVKADLSCPDCATALTVIEIDLAPPVNIERCDACLGLFFNPGELEYLLEAQTSEVVWMDGKEMEEVASAVVPEEVRYRKCPICSDIMTRSVFGGRSGIVIDTCHAHGIWLSAGELRRITKWWRAGGKIRHQVHQRERIEAMRKPGSRLPSVGSGGFPASLDDSPRDYSPFPRGPIWDVFDNPWSKAQILMGVIGLIARLIKK